MESEKKFRYGDKILKKYADELEHNIRVKLKYAHTSDITEEILLELVRRELDRREYGGFNVPETEDEND